MNSKDLQFWRSRKSSLPKIQNYP